MTDLLDVIRDAWAWKHVQPVHVIATNDFGNVLFADDAGRVWRICPEDLACDVVAEDRAAYEELRVDEDFLRDWNMEQLVRLAAERLGPLSEGRCYCLKMPSVLGGAYDADNLGTSTLAELVAFSGDVARQVDELPDGAQIRIELSD